MPVLTVKIPAKLMTAIDRRVARGDYAGLDDYLCHLIRRDQERGRARAVEQSLLRRLDRTGAVDMDAADFAQIRKRFLKRVSGTGRA
jgi:Arc/MetJ-type ribon-helix-helix transcriptional regulator